MADRRGTTGDSYLTGTPEERVLAVLRLGDEILELFLATLPAGTTRAAARRLMQLNSHRGRRPSACVQALQS